MNIVKPNAKHVQSRFFSNQDVEMYHGELDYILSKKVHVIDSRNFIVRISKPEDAKRQDCRIFLGRCSPDYIR